MNNKRAQLSIETMILYGLIILVTMSVIGVLLYFNIIDLGAYLPDACDIGGTGDLKCEEWQFMGTAASGTLELGIRNIGQKPIDLLDVSVEDKSGIHFSGTPNAIGIYNTNPIDGTATAQSLPPGEMAKVSITTSAALPGKLLRGNLQTRYRFKEGVIVQEAKGSIRTKAN